MARNPHHKRASKSRSQRQSGATAYAKREADGARAMVREVGVCVRALEAQGAATRKAFATRFKIHTTDLEVIDLILSRGPASPGEIAKATRLTSGAVTALIDRLAATGYVRRQSDPSDRRRALVSVRHNEIEPIKAVYDRVQTRTRRLWSRYSDDELAIIADFLTRSTALVAVYVRELTQKGSAPARRRRRTRRCD